MLAIKALELVIAYIIVFQKLAHFYCLEDYFLNKFSVNIITVSFLSRGTAEFRRWLFFLYFISLLKFNTIH